MNFRERLQQQMNNDFDLRLSSLEGLISRFRDRRYLKIDLQENVDFQRKYFFWHKLLEPGQRICDKLVELGFKPEFTFGGDWSGGPGFYIRW